MQQRHLKYLQVTIGLLNNAHSVDILNNAIDFGKNSRKTL